MGQALRRATGKARPPPPRPAQPPPEPARTADSRPPQPEPARTADSRQPPPDPARTADSGPPPAGQMAVQDRLEVSDSEGVSRNQEDLGILQERDPSYEAMLSRMVGTVKSKPGGKHEMGEAFIVEKYNKPLPKLRSSKTEAGVNEQRPAPPGTLSAVQLQQIILLHQGKSNDHQGPMEVNEIAKRFKIEVAHVEKILQFVSLPPEHHKNTQQ